MDSLLIFLGVAVSLAVELVKNRFGTSPTVTMGTVVVLALAAAGACYFLKLAGLWEAVLEILTTAGAFYAFIIRNLKSN